MTDCKSGFLAHLHSLQHTATTLNKHGLPAVVDTAVHHLDEGLNLIVIQR